MIQGNVSEDGVPLIHLPVAGRRLPAVIDTGFNGYLELPENLRRSVKARFIGHLESSLAAGQMVMEDNYAVEFPFDNETLEVEATFAPGDVILIGTGLLRGYRLEIDFPDGTVKLEKRNPH